MSSERRLRHPLVRGVLEAVYAFTRQAAPHDYLTVLAASRTVAPPLTGECSLGTARSQHATTISSGCMPPYKSGVQPQPITRLPSSPHLEDESAESYGRGIAALSVQAALHLATYASRN